MAKNKKIVKFKPLYHLNIAVIVSAILLIYLGFHVISYLTRKNIPIYEVQAGTIAQNNHYQALAIRSESVINTDHKGKPFYYAQNGTTVGVMSDAYALDDTGTLVDKMNSASTSLSDVNDKDLSSLQESLSSFVQNYDPNTFSKAYTFYSDLSDSMNQTFHLNTAAQFEDQIQSAENAGTYHKYKSAGTGYLLFSLDGGEGLTVDNFTEDSLNDSYKVVDLRTTEEVEEGKPIYKLVTSDNWNLIMKINDATKQRIGDSKNIRIRFDDDQAETICGVNYIEKDGNTYLNLELNDSVERYAAERVVSIELILDKQNGLKIPNSAITEKDFFVIPKEYFLQGNDSDKRGLMVVSGDTDTFVTPTIFYETEDSLYIDNESVKADEEIRLPDSIKRYRVGTKTGKLKGVFNVNKGYAIFNRVEVLFQNNDYSVISSGTAYGISLYDHIALDGKDVSENEIIH